MKTSSKSMMRALVVLLVAAGRTASGQELPIPRECLTIAGSLAICAFACPGCIPSDIDDLGALLDLSVPTGGLSCGSLVQEQACTLTDCCAACEPTIRSLIECVGDSANIDGCGQFDCSAPLETPNPDDESSGGGGIGLPIDIGDIGVGGEVDDVLAVVPQECQNLVQQRLIPCATANLLVCSTCIPGGLGNIENYATELQTRFAGATSCRPFIEEEACPLTNCCSACEDDVADIFQCVADNAAGIPVLADCGNYECDGTEQRPSDAIDPPTGIEFPQECQALIDTKVLQCMANNFQQCEACVPSDPSAYINRLETGLSSATSCSGLIQEEACPLTDCCPACEEAVEEVFSCIADNGGPADCSDYNCDGGTGGTGSVDFPEECQELVTNEFILCAALNFDKCTECIPPTVSDIVDGFSAALADASSCSEVIEGEACPITNCCEPCEAQMGLVFQCIRENGGPSDCGTYTCDGSEGAVNFARSNGNGGSSAQGVSILGALSVVVAVTFVGWLFPQGFY